MRKTRELLMKLSLNAEKNWHQNKGAKRRVIIRDEDIAGLSLPGLEVEWQSLETTIWTKEQSCRAPRLHPSNPDARKRNSIKMKRAAAGRPLLNATSRLYPRSVRCVAGCIMTAATLRQTAIPDATVKSDIHMARFPSFLLSANAHLHLSGP